MDANSGVTYSIRASDKKSPDARQLVDAVEKYDMNTLRARLSECPASAVNARDELGRSALFEAIGIGNTLAVLLLLQHGAGKTCSLFIGE